MCLKSDRETTYRTGKIVATFEVFPVLLYAFPLVFATVILVIDKTANLTLTICIAMSVNFIVFGLLLSAIYTLISNISEFFTSRIFEFDYFKDVFI